MLRTRSLFLAATLLVVTLAGCASDAPAPAADDEEIAAVASLPAYFHNLSAVLPQVTLEDAVEHHYRIPMADGVKLDSWILVPNGVDGPVPLVLEITPYYGGGSIKECKIVPGVTDSVACLVNQVDNLLKRGYAIGFLSVRGTGASEGCFTQGGPQEAKDSAAAIEYLAAQPWSNANVAVIGLSYVGTTANDVWVEAPPSLKTVVTMAGITELYNYNFVNGVHIEPQGYSFNLYYWPIVGLAPAGIEGGTNTNPTEIPNSYVHEACPDQADVQLGGLHGALTSDYSGYWQVRNFSAEYLQEPEKERPSMLYFMGLEDWNVKPHNIEPFYSHVKDSGVPLFTLMSKQSHLWPLREDWSHEILVAWLDEFLKGRDTGILDAPPVWLQDDDGVWRYEKSWPPEDSETRRLAFGDAGALEWNATGSSANYSYRSVPHEAAVDPDGPNVAVLKSDPLEEELHLTHMPRLRVAAQADAPRAVLAVTLAEEYANGTVRTINWALQSLNHLGTPEKGRQDITGERIEGWVPFFPQEDVVHKGSRLVVYVSNYPIIEGEPGPSMRPFPSTAEVTVFSEGTWIDLLIDPTITAEEPQPRMLELPDA